MTYMSYNLQYNLAGSVSKPNSVLVCYSDMVSDLYTFLRPIQSFLQMFACPFSCTLGYVHSSYLSLGRVSQSFFRGSLKKS